jgi:hypothetical protein
MPSRATNRRRWLRAWHALAAVGIAASTSAACGDLVMPATPDGGGQGGDDDSGVVAIVDANDGAPNCVVDADHPQHVACTGLYVDWDKRTIAPDAHQYVPAFSMWNDTAVSTRWIYLPPNAKIDSSNLDGWIFPVGTKAWQELQLLGKRVETRFLWKVAPGYWFRTTYVWSDDQSTALEQTLGVRNARGLGYEIPPSDQCATCHNGAPDFLLGFELVSLAQSTSTGLNEQALAQQGLLTNVPTALPVVPGDPTSASALGFLHANCGTSCHNAYATAAAGSTGLLMKLVADSKGALPATVQATPTWTTSYKIPSTFTPEGFPLGSFMRIKPQDAPHSSVAWRCGRRDSSQMPPLATHAVDWPDVQKLNFWIASMPP